MLSRLFYVVAYVLLSIGIVVTIIGLLDIYRWVKLTLLKYRRLREQEVRKEQKREERVRQLYPDRKRPYLN